MMELGEGSQTRACLNGLYILGQYEVGTIRISRIIVCYELTSCTILIE